MVMEAIQIGWSRFKDNAIFSVVMSFLVIGIMILPSMVMSVFGEEAIFMGLFFYLVAIVLFVFFQIGLISIGLKVVDGEEPQLSDLFSNISVLGAFIIGNIIFNFASGIASMLFILPGIYVAIRLMVWPFLVVDQKMSGSDAIRTACEIVLGNFVDFLLMTLALGFINMIGSLTVVGILLTFPLTLYSFAAFYRGLGGSANKSFTEDFTDPNVVAKYKAQSYKYGEPVDQASNPNPNVYDGPDNIPEYLREDPLPPKTQMPKTQQNLQESQDRFGYNPGTFAKDTVHQSPLESTVSSIVDMGNKKYKQGDFFGAIQSFTKAIELEKKNPKHYYSRGTARIKTMDYLGAIEDFTRATKLKPDFAKAWFNLGVVKSKISDPNAKNDIMEALRLDPSLKKLLRK